MMSPVGPHAPTPPLRVTVEMVLDTDSKQGHPHDRRSLCEPRTVASGQEGGELCVAGAVRGLPPSWEEAEVLPRSHVFVHGKWINVVCITECFGNVLRVISGMGKVQHSLEPKCPHYQPIQFECLWLVFRMARTCEGLRVQSERIPGARRRLRSREGLPGLEARSCRRRRSSAWVFVGLFSSENQAASSQQKPEKL